MNPVARHLTLVGRKKSPHSVTGQSQATIWQECRDYWVSQGDSRAVAGERAWLHLDESGSCDHLMLRLVHNASPVTHPKGDQSDVKLPDAIMYCPTHESHLCNPARCTDVRLYEWTPTKRVAVMCQAPYCGITFHAERSTARYCSRACRQRALRARPRTRQGVALSA